MLVMAAIQGMHSFWIFQPVCRFLFSVPIDDGWKNLPLLKEDK
jgi:hypothetical protein